jgi:hypothetical protein
VRAEPLAEQAEHHHLALIVPPQVEVQVRRAGLAAAETLTLLVEVALPVLPVERAEPLISLEMAAMVAAVRGVMAKALPVVAGVTPLLQLVRPEKEEALALLEGRECRPPALQYHQHLLLILSSEQILLI